MLADIFLIIVGWLMNTYAAIAPTWTLWPPILLSGLTYMFSSLNILNIFIPINTLYDCIQFFINFNLILIGVKIISMILNYIRGTGEGINI
jgi:hypothetical protein